MEKAFAMQALMQRQVGVWLLVAAGWFMPCSVWAHAAQSQQEQRQVGEDCAVFLQPMQRALQLVRLQLQAQGMQLITQGCPFVRTQAADMQQVLDVRVMVIDSDVAADFVRGPLADREEVDMGGVHFALPPLAQGFAPAVAEDASPDVLFNREWLSTVMQRQGLQPVAGHWWAFALRKSAAHRR